VQRHNIQQSGQGIVEIVMTPPESPALRILRLLVATALLIEALGLSLFALVATFFGAVIGGIAFVISGGGSSPARGAMAIAATLLTPFLLVVAAGMASGMLFLRQRRRLVASLGGLGVAASIALHFLLDGQHIPWVLGATAFHALVVLVALRSIPVGD
jgi:hypothetical protein